MLDIWCINFLISVYFQNTSVTKKPTGTLSDGRKNRLLPEANNGPTASKSVEEIIHRYDRLPRGYAL